MKPGQASRTAVMVCMARAAAQGRSPVARFDDPVALRLLPDEARRRVEAFRARNPGRKTSRRVDDVLLERRSMMMVARTVAIDDAVRAAPSPQVVILGAGLDGRAWRMRELADATVFEVDHPDSQREKKARVGALATRAREVRFVPVDFERDRLDDALAASGHDRGRATTWIWEGVVMYLRPADVEGTLAVVERRSSPGSRLVIAYGSPTWMFHVVGLILRRVGEPFRSAYTAEAMRAMLSRHGFDVVRDQSLPEIGAALSPDLGLMTRVMKHMRIVTAERLQA